MRIGGTDLPSTQSSVDSLLACQTIFGELRQRIEFRSHSSYRTVNSSEYLRSISDPLWIGQGMLLQKKIGSATTTSVFWLRSRSVLSWTDMVAAYDLDLPEERCI